MSSKKECPICKKRYNVSIAPFSGKLWYDCLSCKKSEEDIEKELRENPKENREKSESEKPPTLYCDLETYEKWWKSQIQEKPDDKKDPSSENDDIDSKFPFWWHHWSWHDDE